MLPTKLVFVILILLVVLAECRRPGRRKRPGGGGRVRAPKKPRFSFFRRSPRVPPRKRPPTDGESDESKNVFYYSIPPAKQQPSRIILGEDLSFNDLGILNQKPVAKKPEVEQDVPKSPSERSPTRIRGGPPPRGPGYRLKNNNWNSQYVLEQEYKPRPKSPPKVMSSMKRGAAEFRKAYQAAVIQSAKVAKLTSHAASRYFKGVRNILHTSGGDHEDYHHGSPTGGYRADHKVDAVPTTTVPDEAETSSSDVKQVVNSDDSSSFDKLLPNVYLDWGGSFWKMFYNTKE